MEFSTFLASDGMKRLAGGSTQCYATTVEGCQLFKLDAPVPFINTDTKQCIGLAFPYEVHMTQNGTTVFFTLMTAIDKSNPKEFEQFKSVMWKLYCMVSGVDVGTAAADYEDTDTPGLNPAMRMMMGMNKDARETARDAMNSRYGDRGSQRRSSRPSAGPSLYETIMGAGGNMCGINDDDDEF